MVVYDYVDSEEPMLAKMAAKRQAGYRSLGYEVSAPGNPIQANAAPGREGPAFGSLLHYINGQER